MYESVLFIITEGVLSARPGRVVGWGLRSEQNIPFVYFALLLLSLG